MTETGTKPTVRFWGRTLEKRTLGADRTDEKHLIAANPHSAKAAARPALQRLHDKPCRIAGTSGNRPGWSSDKLNVVP